MVLEKAIEVRNYQHNPELSPYKHYHLWAENYKGEWCKNHKVTFLSKFEVFAYRRIRGEIRRDIEICPERKCMKRLAMTLEYHPAVDIFPKMSDTEFQELKSDIKENGQRESIKVWNGQIVDGRHRYLACHELQVAPIIENISEDIDPISYVTSLNYHRRHLNIAQKAAVAAEIVSYSSTRPNKEREIYDRQLAAQALIDEGKNRKEAAEELGVSLTTMNRTLANPIEKPESVVTIPEAAQLAGSSTRSAHRAIAIKETAPELHELLKEGKISVNDAYSIREEPDHIRQQAADLFTSGKAVTLRHGVRTAKEQETRQQMKSKAVNQLPTARYKLYNLPINELHKEIEANSVDTIITDPPYEKASLGVFNQLADFALHVLKPGGLLVCLAGEYYIPTKIMAFDKPGLFFRVNACYHMQGPPYSTLTYRLLETKKNLFVYHKYAEDCYTMEDMERWVIGRPAVKNFLTYSYNFGHKQDTDYHKWGQQLEGIEKIVGEFAQPGDIICDPFLGGGTTAIAAIKEGYYFIGNDIDKEQVDISTGRIQEYLGYV